MEPTYTEVPGEVRRNHRLAMLDALAMWLEIAIIVAIVAAGTIMRWWR